MKIFLRTLCAFEIILQITKFQTHPWVQARNQGGGNGGNSPPIPKVERKISIQSSFWCVSQINYSVQIR